MRTQGWPPALFWRRSGQDTGIGLNSYPSKPFDMVISVATGDLVPAQAYPCHFFHALVW